MAATITFNREVLAYNISGIAYEHRVEQQYEGCCFKVRTVSGSKKLDSSAFGTKTSLTPDTVLSGNTSQGHLCLWVGMVHPESEKYTTSGLKHNAIEGGPKKGQSIATSSSTLTVPYCETALKAVVAVTQDQNKYYAIVGESAYRIDQEDIFFFSVFRDDNEPARERRREACSRKITGFKDKLREAKVVKKGKQDQDRAARQVQVQRNLSNEIQGLLATYSRDRRTVHLDALQDLIKKADTDLEHQPLCESLLTLIESKEEVSTEIADKAITEIEKMWEPVKALNIKAREMQNLSRGLVAGQVTLEYGCMRVYIIDWIRSLRQGQVRDNTIGEIARSTQEFARLACQNPPKPPLSISDDDFVAFLDTTVANLRALVQYGRQYMDAATESLGEDASGESLPEIFEKLAVTPDIEGAQQWMREACRYLVREMAYRDEGVIKYLEDLITGLGRLQKSLTER